MSVIEIAKIVKPQGIKGEVKAELSTNVLNIFEQLTTCLVGNKVMSITHSCIRQGFLYIKFAEINTRNDAELLRGQTIKIEKNLLETLISDQEFLVDDLIGMLIFDDEGNFVGQIVDIVNYGASDIIMLEKDSRIYEAPFVDDVFYREGDKLIANKEKLKEVLI